MCIAVSENAYQNGVKFEFNKEVVDIKKEKDKFVIKCSDNSIYETKLVVNAAGLYSDEINNMVSNIKYHIRPRKGEYVLLDKEYGYISQTTLFQLPTKMGKGVLVTPTCHNNILVGPTALDILDKEDVATTYEGLQDVWNKALLTIPSLPKAGIITQFSGLRAHEDLNDFTVEFSKDVDNLYNLIGIESPGLASSPAIGEYAAKEIAKKLGLKEKNSFNPIRKGITHINGLSKDELAKLIKENPLYGKVVCRCEVVSEAEIREAIRRNPGARDLDGVKRRVRAGMGRCQMGFCTPRIMEILEEELKLKPENITKRGPKSEVVIGKIKNM